MRIRVFAIFVGVGVGILFAHGVSAATFSTSPTETTMHVGDHIIVDYKLSGDGEIINAVNALLRYPTDQLAVVDITRGTSFLTLWPQEPTLDKDAGTIRFTGGIPNGTYAFDATVLTVTYEAQSVGTAFLTFDDGITQALLNDGQGTPVMLEVRSGTIGILPPSPASITLTSSTHPDEDAWSNASSFTVRWDPAEGAFYSYILTTNRERVPDDVPEEQVGDVTFEDVADGIHEFILAERLPDEDWQVVARRRIKIDTTPPADFSVDMTQSRSEFDGKVVIHFATTDAPSGILRYDVLEKNVQTVDAASPFTLIAQGIRQDVTVTARDRAGNTTSTTVTVRPSLAVAQNAALGLTFTVIVFLGTVVVLIFIVASLRRRR